jgi:hypothetical protein
MVPCSPLSMSISSLGFDVDCYEGSLHGDLYQSPVSAMRSPIPRGDDSHTGTDYDEDLYDPILCMNPVNPDGKQEEPLDPLESTVGNDGDDLFDPALYMKDQHPVDKTNFTVGNDDDGESMSGVADLVADASLAVYAAQDEVLRLVASLSSPPPTAYAAHCAVHPSRAVSTQQTVLSVPVERRISFFERFARKQNKPTFTRPLRKAASRIRRAMIGRSTTHKAPQEAAIFPFTPPKSPPGQVS